MPEDFSRIWHYLERQDLAEARAWLETMPPADADGPALGWRALLQGELLRREGSSAAAEQQLELACASISDPTWLGAACHGRGLNLRSMGRFEQAAAAFLDALEVEPGRAASLHALQFTRLENESIEGLLGRLTRVVKQARTFPLGLQLLADWEFRLGHQDRALRNSYTSVQLSVTGQQHKLVDWGATPSLPEALIIGAPKSGTTSLAAQLLHHPHLWVHPRKELHFFDNRWDWGEIWYRFQFPVFQAEANIIRLEATPNYLQLPEGPERLQGLIPEARLVVVLREPLDRAISWYHHMVRQEGLNQPLEDVIEAELSGLLELDPQQRSKLGWFGSNCLAGSLYESQLARWYRFFRQDQLLLLRFEDLITKPLETSQRVASHLGVDPHRLRPGDDFPLLNAAPAPYSHLSTALAERCRASLLGDDCALWAGL
jgi:tetratricopeptide (TPR) repeat protein